MPAAPTNALDLVLDSGSLDRGSQRRRDPALVPELLGDPATAVLDVYGEKLAASPDGTRLLRRAPQSGDLAADGVYLGRIDGREWIAVLHEHEDGPGALGLRRLGLTLDPTGVQLAVTAMGVARWHAANAFCPRCGHRLDTVEAGWVRHCPACGRDQYPRTDPAVIMSVIDDQDRLLLARGAAFATKGMSVLAGFVEPGESLEAAVAREVMEEVGVPVVDAQFLGDQPWPFPASLMVGFRCRATEVDLVLDPVEIESARWFTRADLDAAITAGDLRLPGRLSIARHLIEQWYGDRIQQPEHEAMTRRVSS